MIGTESPVRVVTTDKGHLSHLSRNGLRTYCGRPVKDVLGRPGDLIEHVGPKAVNGKVIEYDVTLGANCHRCR